MQGTQISCHTADAGPEERVLSERRNDDNIKRNAEVGFFTKPLFSIIKQPIALILRQPLSVP